MDGTSRLILLFLGAPLVMFVVIIGVRHLTAFIDLEIWGYREVLKEVAIKRGGTLAPGSWQQPYPVMHFEIAGMPARLRTIMPGGSDGDFWTMVSVRLLGEASASFVAVHKPRRRIRGRRLLTGDPAFDGSVTIVSGNSEAAARAFVPRVRGAVLGFVRRTVPSPLATLLPATLARKLQPISSRKHFSWNGSELMVAESISCRSTAELESFVQAAEDVVVSLRSSLTAPQARGGRAG